MLLINAGIESSLKCINTNIPIKSREQEFIETGAKVTLFSMIVASCTYALYKLGSWIFKKTDEQVFQEAYMHHHRIKKEYKTLIGIWIQYYHDEDQLRALPIEDTTTIHNLGRSLNNLALQIKNLNERLQEFNNGKKSTNALESRMQKLHNKIKELHRSLTPIHSYLIKHSDYFDLVQKNRMIERAYSKEINALENNRNDEQTIHKFLTSLIMSNAKKNRYPYIAYIEKLSKDLDALTKSLDESVHSYPAAQRSAQNLKEYLECIHSLIIIHNAYHNELQERERIRLKEQKIALEKEKVRAQQDQARALREQNWLRAQEIYNQEQILRNLDKKDR